MIGKCRGSGGGRSLLLFGHPDAEDPAACPPGAEPAAWKVSSNPFRPTTRGGRMYGWGIADDLVGVAAGVCALEACDSIDFLRSDPFVLDS